MRINPINKLSVLKAVRTAGEWTGYIAPSNVNSFHVTGGWHLGHTITVKQLGDVKTGTVTYQVVRDWDDETMELDEYLGNFRYYNCIAELGKRVRFWQ